MSTFIPLLIVGLVFLQLSLYARAVYLRRMIMLKRVMEYLGREDASLRLKQLVASSFEDTLSFNLPLVLARTWRLQKEEDPRVMATLEECKREEMEDTSSLPAAAEADKIIQMMIRLNLSFNRVLWFASILCNSQAVRVKKTVPIELYKSTPIDLETLGATHQHS
ncbi:hypothetical protein [Kosakonia sp. R1.Fl]|uniref:hypothetical protein n=1 Tax=Kosakonia sp. R1.Fl TaxID=2928706 RepID=UPI00201D6B12|nr:hypothetical protein [Kosakonia sp. R1.Fl]MCL6745103.1 hypothetical protein [Kosakonia sp. R1.Fl]